MMGMPVQLCTWNNRLVRRSRFHLSISGFDGASSRGAGGAGDAGSDGGGGGNGRKDIGSSSSCSVSSPMFTCGNYDEGRHINE